MMLTILLHGVIGQVQDTLCMYTICLLFLFLTFSFLPLEINKKKKKNNPKRIRYKEKATLLKIDLEPETWDVNKIIPDPIPLSS